ncbi:taurine dioxygenase [Amycolatopsis coloradensis]|uniref:Taurine dioxygenase n=1 Tax=Amycolatopsis coloradensis TaxID=76021 RepID=A0A1R0KHM5_9PSEU|nr:TauD/TfdA family dioxygenase [Amycolatopsis coloradensis]OLZ45281.1 taurine dioxygenase [Amycolatopsis coloradensis]
MTALNTQVEVRKITGRIGAQVIGVDPAKDLDTTTVAFLTDALHEHKALVFRDVDLDDASQQRFAGNFGELTKAHPTVPSVDGEPAILPVDSEQGRANQWHTDVTFVHNPPKASTLRSLIVPPYGGETLIANSAAAYRDLPEPLRAFADTLRAEHTNDYDYAKAPETLDEAEQERRKVFVSRKFRTVHPVVRVHPVTGERGLYIGGFAQRIIGLSKGESRDVLRLLQSYVTRPENVVRVTWEPDQLVLFDNRITQHYAVDNYDDLPRRLNRVTVAGDVPVGIDGVASESLEGDASHYSPVA